MTSIEDLESKLAEVQAMLTAKGTNMSKKQWLIEWKILREELAEAKRTSAPKNIAAPESKSEDQQKAASDVT
ncbi:hypothetical protein J7T55_007164 [Diaporthe amygdali]|uniref:uncharacterized protein n=1 Tax=Phomopsis amygdali TaxID=1214568 RepID=UPI0022FE4382|nr:uncharacterized protein J7T55_007164 [Diaporthe amygdali]KAJ0108046.1 hypothetical protein J7T55_007164 [Diaporthe amygdali]